MHAESHVRISWGKDGKVEEIASSGDDCGEDWSESVVVYGIVGILTLFTGTLDFFHPSSNGILSSLKKIFTNCFGAMPVTGFPMTAKYNADSLVLIWNSLIVLRRLGFLARDCSSRACCTCPADVVLKTSDPGLEFANVV